MMTLSEYRQHLENYQIIDCAVRARGIYYFATIDDYTKRPDWDGDHPPDDERRQRLVVHFADDPEGEQWSASHLHHFVGMVVEVARHPKVQAIASCLDRGVYVLGGGDAGMEDPVPMAGATTRLRCIGSQLYAVGTGRQLYRRLAANRWEQFHDDAMASDDLGTKHGFRDIDGFADGDIYAVGGQGDVWRHSGGTWRKCEFPTNLPPYAVCCGNDGAVYIGTQFGHVFKGRENSYRRIHKGNFNIPFRDMVWYDNRVWCTSDYGVWTVEDSELVATDLEAEVKVCAGNLSVGDGVLLMAGYGGAAVLDQGQWTVIYGIHAMKTAARAAAQMP